MTHGIDRPKELTWNSLPIFLQVGVASSSWETKVSPRSKRLRGGDHYHLLPGGGCGAGEDPASAAAREAYEELGLFVRLEGLAAIVNFRGATQYYYVAHSVSGSFGTGTGAEMSSPVTSAAGSYRPVWLGLEDLEPADLRPRPLARRLQEAGGQVGTLLESWLAQPLVIDEIPA